MPVGPIHPPDFILIHQNSLQSLPGSIICRPFARPRDSQTFSKNSSWGKMRLFRRLIGSNYFKVRNEIFYSVKWKIFLVTILDFELLSAAKNRSLYLIALILQDKPFWFSFFLNFSPFDWFSYWLPFRILLSSKQWIFKKGGERLM